MKILILNYEYPPIGGGAAIVSKDLAENLVRNGHKAAVITMKFGNFEEGRNENGVIVYRLPCFRKSKSSCSPIEQLSYLIAVRRFMRRHKELQEYDICHAHFIIPTAVAAKYVKKKYKMPYIITAHGSDVEGHNNKINVVLMHKIIRGEWRKIVSNAYCTVSPSNYLLDKMKYNYTEGIYKYIPNGIEYELFSSLNVFEKKDKRILVMGRLQKFKNVQYAIRAFSKIKGYDEWQMDVIGDGPYRKDLEQIIVECGVSNRVNMLGRFDNKSMTFMECLGKASIFVSASKFENCPMSVIESASAGCYPLLSDIPAHRQMLPSVYLFSLENEDELVEKLKKRMSLGAINYNLNMKKYDWKSITNKYESLMEEAIGSVKR